MSFSSILALYLDVCFFCRNSLGMNIMDKKKRRSLTLMMSWMKLKVSSPLVEQGSLGSPSCSTEGPKPQFSFAS